MTTLTIGKVAQRATVGIETVRFYEREGLIDAPPRGPSGYRHYLESVVPRLLFIKRAKELGFTLNEIKELLSLRLDPDTTCADVKQRAERKIADVEEKMRSLRRMKKTLVKLTESCSGRGPVDDCPILEALDPIEQRGSVMTTKRQVEVFSAGCPACQEAIAMVQDIACPSCEVTVLDMNDVHVASRAKSLGIGSVPAVVIDGQVADCCTGRRPDEGMLRNAGLGRPV